MKGSLCGFAALWMMAAGAEGAQVLTNGDFETGDLTGWTVSTLGTFGNLQVVSGTAASLSGNTTFGPADGTFYALSDQTGQGTYVLRQNFTVAAGASSVILAFQLFANNYAPSTIVDPIGLDHTGPAN